MLEKSGSTLRFMMLGKFTGRFLRIIQQNNDTLPYHLAISVKYAIQLPISRRKILVSCCQKASTPSDLTNLLYEVPIDGRSIRFSEIHHSIDSVVTNPLSCSIFWMILRSCPEPHGLDESEEVYEDGFFKELHATQELFGPGHQAVSYSAFFRNRPGINDPGQWWVDQCHEIRREFSKAVRGVVLYPVVNRTKGVSDMTACEFQQYSSREHVRTVDLEVLYHHTGIQVQGIPEVRSAWKFNDLKPRMYYCNGGQQYWCSRFVKKIAVALMESIPTTFAKKRIDPTSYISASLSDSWISVWDFTSFTSTLAELKYFIFYMARMAEKEQISVTLFDSRYGFTQQPLYDILDAYNQNANMYAPFSIHRMVGRFVDSSEISMSAVNSGMLGVHGNIGFSTALHGLVICKVCGKQGVCVGDDGLGCTNSDPNEELIPALRPLGHVHPEKWGVLGPYEEERQEKFLKRRLMRVGDRLVHSRLFNVPLIPYIDGETHNRTVPPDFSMYQRIFKFATTVSALLWEIFEHPSEISDEDWAITQTFLMCGYKHLNLPAYGLLPGGRIPSDRPGEKDISGFVIPCIHGFDPRKTDWMVHFTSRFSEQFFRVKCVAPKRDVDFYHVGGEGVVTQTEYVAAMEDLGYLYKEDMYEWVQVQGISSVRILRGMSRADEGLVGCCFVRVLKDIPMAFAVRLNEEQEKEYDVEMADFF